MERLPAGVVVPGGVRANELGRELIWLIYLSVQGWSGSTTRGTAAEVAQ